MKKTVIFDMDGVIFDTENLILQAWRELARQYGYDESEMEKVFYSCIGTNAQVTKQLVLAHYGSDFPYETFRSASSDWFQQSVRKNGMPVKEGARQLLAYLKKEGFVLGLASSTRSLRVKEELESAGLKEYFDVIIGGDMVEHSKPEPDVFLKCCEEMRIAPEQVYIIEDSFNGVRAARKARATVIMVPDLIMPDEEMERISDHIMPSLLQVKEFFERRTEVDIT
ncbi:MAG: HAD family phosphatase [Lachnospiraceae bacterium]|nr:HAD family phosphatase [Lachnospiraceae bacterium]